MSTPEKEAAVQRVTEILENAKGVFVNDFQGLDVEKMGELRSKCRESSVEYLVVKNTLARIAAKNAGYEEMVEFLTGPSAIAYSFEDPSAPARVITEFAKKAEKPTIKLSLFEGLFYGPDKVQTIASLPSKEVLLSKIAGGFMAPIQGFAGNLHGLLHKFVMTLDAVRAEKEKAEN